MMTLYATSKRSHCVTVPGMDHILSLFNPVHTFRIPVSKFDFNIILPSMLRYPNGPHYLDFRNEVLYVFLVSDKLATCSAYHILNNPNSNR